MAVDPCDGVGAPFAALHQLRLSGCAAAKPAQAAVRLFAIRWRRELAMGSPRCDLNVIAAFSRSQMRERFYTQGLAILLRQAVEVDAIEERLTGFTVVSRTKESAMWAFGGPGSSLSTGLRSTDTYRSMPSTIAGPIGGDPNTEPEVFTAWSMGHFGPGTWPGSLERARQHSWGWPDGRSGFAEKCVHALHHALGNTGRLT
jgi:hypothetical protein